MADLRAASAGSEIQQGDRDAVRHAAGAALQLHGGGGAARALHPAQLNPVLSRPPSRPRHQAPQPLPGCRRAELPGEFDCNIVPRAS